MNVQVNLIRAPELRSASMVSLKSLGWIAVIILPLVLLLCLGWVYMGYAEARSKLRLLEEEKERTAPQRREVRTLNQTLSGQQGIYNEVMGWHHSRVPWHEMLDVLRPHVPETMQWRSLQMRQQMSVAKDGNLLREPVVVLSGRCQGPEAEAQVEMLRRAWSEVGPLARRVEQATVTAYREDETPGAAKEDRVFQIEVKFRPGRFHAPAR